MGSGLKGVSEILCSDLGYSALMGNISADSALMGNISSLPVDS